MGTTAEQVIGDDDIATVDYKREFPHGEMDIVIINPPFSKNADGNSNNRKGAFKAKTERRRREVNDGGTEEKSPRIANGNNGLGSWFVDMSSRKLKRVG